MQEVSAVIFYKVFCVCCGTFIVCLGYRLYTLGIFKSSGDIDATINNNRILLKRAAPGTLFVILGCAVIASAVTKGITVTYAAPTAAASTSPVQVEPTTIAGAGELDGARYLALAKAVNTLILPTATDQQAPSQEVRGTAISILREWRTTMAEKYGTFNAKDIEFYNTHLRDADRVSLSNSERTRWNSLNVWLGTPLSE